MASQPVSVTFPETTLGVRSRRGSLSGHRSKRFRSSPYTKRSSWLRWRAGRTARPRGGLRPQITYVNRRVTESLNLTTVPTTGTIDNWNVHSDYVALTPNAISRALAFKLSDLNNSSEFSNLFESYKITHVDLTVTPSTQLGESEGLNSSHGNASNLIVRYRTNRYGLTTAGVSLMQWNEVQNQKIMYLNGSKPLFMRIWLNQASEIYSSAVNTDYGAQRPEFISTTEVDTPHYGSAIRIEMIDGTQPLSGNGISLRFDFNVHIQLKGIK